MSELTEEKFIEYTKLLNKNMIDAINVINKDKNMTAETYLNIMINGVASTFTTVLDGMFRGKVAQKKYAEILCDNTKDLTFRQIDNFDTKKDKPEIIKA